MSNLDEITIGDNFETNGSVGSNTTVVQIGERIGAYEVTAFLGRGGMGEVYEAFAAAPSAVAVGTPVAIKFLRQGQFSPTNRRRFEREAAYLKALNHPGIVRLYEILEWNGHPCIVMQYAPGRNLDEIMPGYGDPHLAEPHIADLIAQALEALHAAHLAGILHRDLKPGNLRISPQGRVMILDFGMAMRREERESRLTASGSILGTPAYMSPEQARGQQDSIGPRSDIYAMGAVLYELATGKQPFYAPNPVALLRCILDEPLTLPSKLRPEISRDLETVIAIAMSKDPRDRFESAEAMAADLRRLHRGQRIRRRRTSRWKLMTRSAWFHRRVIALWSLGIFVIFAGAMIGVEHYNNKAKEVEEKNRKNLELEAKFKKEMERQQENWGKEPVWSCPKKAWEQNEVWTSEKTLPFHPSRPNGVKGWQIMAGPGTPLRIDSGIDIEAQITPLTSESGEVELFFNSKNYSEMGYGVILSLGGKDSKSKVQIVKGTRDRLDGRNYEIMAQESLPETPATFYLRIQRDGAKIQVFLFLNDTMIPEFVDLEPIEGLEWCNTYVVFNPLTVKIQDLQIKRQRPSELVNRIALADIARMQDKYEYAIALYEAYLRDFPNTSQATQATYGLALAKLGLAGFLSERSIGKIAAKNIRDDLAKMAVLEDSLGLFRSIVEDPSSTERYRLAALFRAWSTSVRLGEREMKDANDFFEKLKATADLDKLLKVTPLYLLQDLPNRYAQEANRLRYKPGSLENALELYQKAIDLAKYLSRDKRLDGNIIVQCYTSMNDLLWNAGRYDQALEVLQTAEKTIEPFRLPITTDLIAAQAETCMLLDQTNSSTNAAMLWHRILGSMSTLDVKNLQANDPRLAHAERARIWLGQILQEDGNIAGAQRIWNGQSNALSGVEEKTANHIGATGITQLLARRKDLPFDRAFLTEKKTPTYLWADLIYLRVLRLMEQKPLRPETVDQCLMLIDEALDLPIADPNDKNGYYTNFPIPLLLNLRECLIQEVTSP